MRDISYRFSTTSARIQVAAKLGLHYDHLWQDWEIEVANSSKIDEYLNLYASLKDEDEKFVLMQIIFQAINDLDELVEIACYWDKIHPMLVEEYLLHRFTIRYWASLENRSPVFEWPISPYLRTLSVEQGDNAWNTQ